jgi:WD40 repeat protein
LVTVDQTGHGVLWDVASERAVAALPVVSLPGVKYDVAFSPDGTEVAVAASPTIVVDIRTMKTVFVRPPQGHAGADATVGFSADGRVLATANGPDIALWDLSTGQPDRAALQGESAVNQLQFSHDGRLLAAGLANGTTELWDAHNFQASGAPLAGQNGKVNQAVFVAGDSLLVTATTTSVAEWDTDNVNPLASTLSAGPNGITSVAFSPDGQSAAATDTAGEVKLWTLSHGQPVDPPILVQRQGGASATAVSFSPDGRRMAIGSSSGALLVVDRATSVPAGPALLLG